jgi:diguanylate cyclase (GGDEF)-like protein
MRAQRRCRGGEAAVRTALQPRSRTAPAPNLTDDCMTSAASETEPSGDLARKLTGDRVELLYRHARGGLVATGGAALLLLLAVTSGRPTRHQLIWLAAMYAVVLARVIDLFLQRASDGDVHRRPHRWLARFAAGVLASAIVWDVFALAWLGQFGVAQRSMVVITLIALAGGGVAFFSSFAWLEVAFAALMLGPVSLALLLDGGFDNLLLGVLGIGIGIAIAALVKNAQRSTLQTLRYARQNELLLAETDRRRCETEALNAQLSAARQDLLEANRGLEDKVRRRTEELQREIGERMSYQRELERIADRDPLTQLGNRTFFSREVDRAIGRAIRDSHRLAIYFVDLDRFKQVNDGLGHAIGDRVLQIAAQRLDALAAARHAVARWGGDEFVVLEPQLREVDEVFGFGNELVQALSQPIQLEQGSVLIGASIGVSVFPEDGDSADKLVENADLAVYQAKREGRGSTCLYRPEWGVAARDRLLMAQALRGALESQQLQLHFQPIVDVTLGRAVGMEALCRWPHPDRGWVPPAAFIPVAEESGLIARVGNWVLNHACEQLQRQSGIDGIMLAVNASVLQLLDKNFIANLDATLACTGFPPQRLKIEITESLFAENTEQVQAVLQALRRRGVRISLDDFGTGYSSLGYLRKFPVDELKVDASFVRDLDAGGESIIKAVLSMGTSLGLGVVIEGVETAAQYQRVIALGATRLQGFYISRGLPADTAFREFGSAWLPARTTALRD